MLFLQLLILVILSDPDSQSGGKSPEQDWLAGQYEAQARRRREEDLR